jgi:hypothetical protein
MKVIKYLLLIPVIIAFGSCSDYDHRLIVKTIRIDKKKYIEWYRYSLIGSYSPYYIDLKESNGDYKHIFIHEKICDVDLNGDTLDIVVDKAFATIFYEKANIGLKLRFDSSTFCLK